MTSENDSSRLRNRLIIAGILAAAGVALSLVDHVAGAGTGKVANDFAAAHAGSAQINAAVDAVLDRFAIVPKSITSWKVLTPDRRLLRLEQRIVVPHDFPTVECNHELSQRVLPLGGRVAATERSREKVVTMHIVSHGEVIRTIAFAMRPSEPDGRVEQTKARQPRKGR